MIKVISVEALPEEGWDVLLAVDDGVYHLPGYPVRVLETPRPPDDVSDSAVRQLVGEFAVQRAQRHLRQGSLPPHGMIVLGQEIWQKSEG
ncbi:MAG: hypothetical protein OWS74_04560 [Firmicutes bacterium]|nr:hypothetical protein [Bacillota bacterium]